MRTLITNGTIVTAASTYQADLLIDNGVIAQIGRQLSVGDVEQIDATGKYVFPGAIDVHTHIDTPFGKYTTVDDWRAGTIAAACGGTTTVVDFALQARGQSLRSAIDGWHSKAEGKAVIDYSFHAMIQDLSDSVRQEIPLMIAEGIPSFKVFMAYKGLVQADDETLFRTLLLAREHGGLTMVHAENGDAIVVLQQRLAAEGKLAPKYWALSRPPELEGEATHRAIVLAQLAEAPLYVVHMTNSLAVDALSAARSRGQPVYGETCPQYLMLSVDQLAEPDGMGAKYICAPPLRSSEHQAALWQALANGTLQTVGTDHSAWMFKGQKDQSLDDFRGIINGMPGIEERLFVLYTYGVLAGRMSLNRFVDVTATAPARLFGLYPRKGDIAIGADADLVVWDPEVAWTLSVDRMHSKVDYCVYEGLEVRGATAYVLSRGAVVVRDHQFVGQAGAGRFLRRLPFRPLL
ncbi:MAG: dihydropyrimidinase [Kouleothrix sp.]|nr:dihydropyrimidinase [Kouleothrix sp.]